MNDPGSMFGVTPGDRERGQLQENLDPVGGSSGAERVGTLVGIWHLRGLWVPRGGNEVSGCLIQISRSCDSGCHLSYTRSCQPHRGVGREESQENGRGLPPALKTSRNSADKTKHTARVWE